VLCEQLCAEALLLFPFCNADARQLAGGSGNWRALFLELWPLRHRFGKFSDDLVTSISSSECFRLSAHCRVKPVAHQKQSSDVPVHHSAVSVNLMPLHQRLGLLRQSQPELTHKQAMESLLAKDSNDSNSQNSDSPSTGFLASVLSVSPGRVGSVLTVSPGIGIRNWEFDNVFPEDSRQHDIYKECGLRLAVDLLNGSSGALIVYGQTGSGKTHTMFGPAASEADPVQATDVGLVPRIAYEILQGMESRRASGFDVSLGASYVEVFGNDVNNLLGGAIGVNRAANQRMGHRYILNGQCEVPVCSREVFDELLAQGEESKRLASTQMNERSSRAHTILILRLRQKAPGQEAFAESTVSLVDLGGSERVSKSKAGENIRNPGALRIGDEEVCKVSWQEYYHGRERITETNYINKGLLSLKRCIQALIERQRRAQTGGQSLRVPYMDNKLTMLLEPVLSGGTRTTLIVCCRAEDQHAEETVQSLRFGEMCSYVQQDRSSGVVPDANNAVSQALKAIEAELRDVEAEIRQKERWEWRAQTRTHVVNEMDAGGTVVHANEVMELGGAGAVEIQDDEGTSHKHEIAHQVWGQVLVGAEVENARREELLKRRQRLLGESEIS